MNDPFKPALDYDYTFLGLKPEEWLDNYLADMDEEELSKGVINED